MEANVMALPLIGGLLSSVGDIAGTWVKGKMEEKKAQTEIKVAKAKAEATVYEKQATGELDMEKSLTEQMGGSWKDEAWTIFFIAVLAGCFLPWTQDAVKEGFVFLDESTPDWFANCIYISISASFGYRVGKAGMGMIGTIKNGNKIQKKELVKKDD
jgi:hypothetical protein